MAAREDSNDNSDTIRTIRFRMYGEPSEVLQLERIAAPEPAANRIREIVHACGLNPAGRALCRGLFPGSLPRGIGLDVSGIVDAIGGQATDVAAFDRVMGSADFAGAASAGARGSRDLESLEGSACSTRRGRCCSTSARRTPSTSSLVCQRCRRFKRPARVRGSFRCWETSRRPQLS